MIKEVMPSCYRCAFGKEYPNCDLFCVKFTEELFTSSAYTLRRPEADIYNVTAVLTEPSQEAMGRIISPKRMVERDKKGRRKIV